MSENKIMLLVFSATVIGMFISAAMFKTMKDPLEERVSEMERVIGHYEHEAQKRGLDRRLDHVQLRYSELVKQQQMEDSLSITRHPQNQQK